MSSPVARDWLLQFVAILGIVRLGIGALDWLFTGYAIQRRSEQLIQDAFDELERLSVYEALRVLSDRMVNRLRGLGTRRLATISALVFAVAITLGLGLDWIRIGGAPPVVEEEVQLALASAALALFLLPLGAGLLRWWLMRATPVRRAASFLLPMIGWVCAAYAFVWLVQIPIPLGENAESELLSVWFRVHDVGTVLRRATGMSIALTSSSLVALCPLIGFAWALLCFVANLKVLGERLRRLALAVLLQLATRERALFKDLANMLVACMAALAFVASRL